MTSGQCQINANATSWSCIDVEAALHKGQVHAGLRAMTWLLDPLPVWKTQISMATASLICTYFATLQAYPGFSGGKPVSNRKLSYTYKVEYSLVSLVHVKPGIWTKPQIVLFLNGAIYNYRNMFLILGLVFNHKELFVHMLEQLQYQRRMPAELMEL